MSVLLYGALNYKIVDWDVGITLLMGSLTYILAPWSVTLILSAIRYRQNNWIVHVLFGLLLGLFVVDWVYMLYHTLVGNETLRSANFYVSMPLYFLTGTVWLYNGSLKDLWLNIVRLP
jgi:hypothetical protein